MKIFSRWRSLCALAVIVSLSFLIPAANAVPAYQEAVEKVQPDGKKIKVKLNGDEFYSWQEDENGYVIENDPKDKFWKYAKPKSNSVEMEIIPDAVVGEKDPAKMNLKKKDLPST